jgi:hypothetical protein
MKRLGFVTLLVIIAFAVSSVATSQFVTGYNPRLTAMDGNGVTLAYQVTVDSLQADTTKAFQIGLYDDNLFAAYPIMVGYKTTSTWGKPHVLITIQGGFGDGVWTTIDTVVTNDSLETYAQTTLDLNSKVYPYYRLIFTGKTNADLINNRSDSYSICTLYFYRKGY